MAEAPKRQRPKAPANLSARGRRLWRDVVGVYDLRADELVVLEQACRESDLIDTMAAALEGEPLTVDGSRGQLVAHPLVAELRQHRLCLRGLLAQLKLPDEGDGAGRGANAASVAGRNLVAARWRR